ncbi:ESCRT-II complex subunit-domain-containing protein [Nemania sp. FL0916]|nr:ESCRT-II complex subunit-domain-containing protein [Nemania sp. FL0916]
MRAHKLLKRGTILSHSSSSTHLTALKLEPSLDSSSFRSSTQKRTYHRTNILASDDQQRQFNLRYYFSRLHAFSKMSGPAAPAPGPSSPTTTSPSPLGAMGPLTPSTFSSTSALTPTTTTNTSTPAATPSVATGGSSNTSFIFPKEYNFPPYFTRQLNQMTRHHQYTSWSSLLLSYCSYHRLFKLSVNDSVFHNTRIGRKLSPADAHDVLLYMQRQGRAEFGADTGENGGEGGETAWIYWRTPDEWAQRLETWIEETGQKGTVLTLYELTQGEGMLGTDFYGLDADVLNKALRILVQRNKAQIFGQDDQLGVKFF